MNVLNFVELIKEDKYQKQLTTMKRSELNKTKLKKFVHETLMAVTESLNSGYMAQHQLHLEGRRPLTVGVETGIVNLPYENIDKVTKIMTEEDNREVAVYLTASSDFLNKSGFRIDQLATADDVISDEQSFESQMISWVEEKMQLVKDYQVEEPKKSESKKETKKKTEKSTKKTTKKAKK
ncbi:hypothetical protein [Holzapfeliella floricola]|uniref:Uncharacterized protein n=1 Tax=Holzapfeliella floricola DSM 23037 = JCM 16512 TaxID=1423744 RepID=A0A0R2DKF9_9LACO|nr:hypothetical protein [Holzapfeliella floricola]KRN04584.1 hypothetical protein FC86_GL000032 [Holzapfeliella floricola DSM 23037 = JCM 16512]